MAQFATRFEDTPLGDRPVWWTSPWSAAEWTVGEYSEPGGGRGVRTSGSGGARRVLLWHHAGLPRDVELLTAGVTTSSSGNQLRLHARTWGHAGAETGVYCELNGGSSFLIGGYVGNASATISGPRSIAFAWSANALYWMRLRLEGALVRAKVWEDGTPEPEDWTVEGVIEDSELLEPGNVGLGWFTSSGIKHFIGLAVGTDGDEATFAADQPEPETRWTTFAEFEEGPLPPELVQPFLGSSEPAAKIAMSGAGESHLGDRYIVQEPLTTVDGHRHVRWLVPEAENATQILARVRSLVGGPGLLGPGLNSWREGAGNQTQHSAVLRGPSTVEINRLEDGAFSVLTNATRPIAVGAWYWIRFEIEIGDHSQTNITSRAKFWEDGTPEPAGWDLEHSSVGSDARPIFGWAGLYITSGANRHEIDFLSVANRGATAPGLEAIGPSRPSLTVLGAELHGSPYVHPVGVGHRASRWQVALADSDFSDPVWDSGLTEQELLSASPEGLTPGLSYRARVLYQDANGNLSEWSEAVAFDHDPGQWEPCGPRPDTEWSGPPEPEPDETPYRDLVLSQGPELYWRGHDATGSTAHDETSHGRHGTYDGVPVLRRPGVFPGSLYSVSLPPGSSIVRQWEPWMARGSDENWLSVDAWIQLDDVEGRSVIASMAEFGSLEGAFILYVEGARLHLEERQVSLSGNVSVRTYTVNYALSPGVAHFVRASMLYSSIGISRDIYIDGAIRFASIGPGGWTQNSNTNQPLIVGPVRGRISDVTVRNGPGGGGEYLARWAIRNEPERVRGNDWQLSQSRPSSAWERC